MTNKHTVEELARELQSDEQASDRDLIPIHQFWRAPRSAHACSTAVVRRLASCGQSREPAAETRRAAEQGKES